HEATRSRPQGFEDVLIKIERGEDQDARHRADALEQAPCGLDAVQPGHSDGHEDDVWTKPPGSVDGVGAVDGFTDDLDIGFRAEDASKAGADHRLVVGDQDITTLDDGTASESSARMARSSR